MKKYILCFVVIFILLLSSCEKLENKPVDNSSVMSEDRTNYYTYDDNCYDIYNMNINDSVFDNSIKNNPIDKDYEEEFCFQAITTYDFINVQKKYITIWKEELSDTIDRYIKLLSSENKELFLKSQSKWKEYFESEFTFENAIFGNNEYQYQFGSSFEYTFLSDQMRVIRERTIKVKYLYYLLESSTNDSGDYDSIIFLYSSTRN